MEITLYTASGLHEVTTVAVPPFHVWPEIIAWGERFFVLQNVPSESVPPRYHEGLVYVVLPPADPTW